MAAGAQLLASSAGGPAGAPRGGFASWLARGAGPGRGDAAGAAAQPQWVRAGLSVLGLFAPELKVRVPQLLGALRLLGAAADDLAVFALAFLLSRHAAAGGRG